MVLLLRFVLTHALLGKVDLELGKGILNGYLFYKEGDGASEKAPIKGNFNLR